MDDANPITGMRRRKARRLLPKKKRQSLSCAPASKWLAVQAMMSAELHLALVNLHLECLVFFLAFDFGLDDEQPHQMSCVLVTSSNLCCGLAYEMTMLDSMLMDVPEHVFEESGHRKDLVGMSLATHDNDDLCQQQTRFCKQEIITLHNGMPLGGFVHVCHFAPKHHKFDLMELLMCALRKMSTGRTHKDLCDDEFGGCPKRWGCGHNHSVCLMDGHFAPLMGPQGVSMWAHVFPQFAEAVRECMARPREKKDGDGNVTEVWMHDFPIPPGAFNIFGFTDCTACECCGPGSGPSGAEAGAPRNADWCLRQRAFYDGHHRGMEACLKTLTICLPNGLAAAACGPASGRDDDRTMFRLAEFDDCTCDLSVAHHGGDHLHCVCGDAMFAGCWSSLRTAHHAPPGHNLTEEQESLSENMKSARECIEWSCGGAESMFPLLTAKHHSKIEVDSGRVFAEVRVMHLLDNFNMCCHEGSAMTGERMFRFAPPALEECLDMNTNVFTE